jgi:hypothetical protein
MISSPIKSAADVGKTEKPQVVPPTQPEINPAEAKPLNPAHPGDVAPKSGEVKK